MDRSKSIVLVLALAAIAATPASAHRSLGSVDDSSRQVTVEGHVAELQFVNPHPILIVEFGAAGAALRRQPSLKRASSGGRTRHAVWVGIWNGGEMQGFCARRAMKISGVLSCFDRMLFRGCLPIMHGAAMAQFPEATR